LPAHAVPMTTLQMIDTATNAQNPDHRRISQVEILQLPIYRIPRTSLPARRGIEPSRPGPAPRDLSSRLDAVQLYARGVARNRPLGRAPS
jgi:hypothetical protein